MRHLGILGIATAAMPVTALASDFGEIGAALVLGPLALVVLIVAIYLFIRSRSEHIGGFAYAVSCLIALPLVVLSIGGASSAWSNDMDKPLYAWGCILLSGLLVVSFIRFNLRYWGQHFTR